MMRLSASGTSPLHRQNHQSPRKVNKSSSRNQRKPIAIKLPKLIHHDTMKLKFGQRHVNINKRQTSTSDSISTHQTTHNSLSQPSRRTPALANTSIEIVNVDDSGSELERSSSPAKSNTGNGEGSRQPVPTHKDQNGSPLYTSGATPEAWRSASTFEKWFAAVHVSHKQELLQKPGDRLLQGIEPTSISTAIVWNL